MKYLNKQLNPDGTGFFEILLKDKEPWMQVEAQGKLTSIFSTEDEKIFKITRIVDSKNFEKSYLRSEIFFRVLGLNKIDYRDSDPNWLEKARDKNSLEEANQIIQDFIDYLQSILLKKGEEYIGKNASRFHNFEVSAKIKGNSLIDVLDGYQLKHKASLRDMISDFEEGKLHPLEKWKEKLGDDIIYSILLFAMIQQKGFYIRSS